jgi:hypothetical protein
MDAPTESYPRITPKQAQFAVSGISGFRTKPDKGGNRSRVYFGGQFLALREAKPFIGVYVKHPVAGDSVKRSISSVREIIAPCALVDTSVESCSNCQGFVNRAGVDDDHLIHSVPQGLETATEKPSFISND